MWTIRRLLLFHIPVFEGACIVKTIPRLSSARHLYLAAAVLILVAVPLRAAEPGYALKVVTDREDAL